MAYLDNSATTRPCPAAVDAMVRCMTEGYYNPSSVYRPAVDAFRAVREARETLLGAVHVGSTCNLIFTSGGTEANNLAILGSAATLRDRRVVAVTAVEHPSVRESYEKLREGGFDVRVIGVNERGELDWAALEKALDDGAALVSCMQVNNETGALLDCERLYRTVAGRARIHIDGVQGFLRVPFDMKYADLYTISGHKIHGPKGIGALIVKKGVRLIPRQIGGGQGNDERKRGNARFAHAEKARNDSGVSAGGSGIGNQRAQSGKRGAAHREHALSRRARRGNAARVGGGKRVCVHGQRVLVEKAEGERRADGDGHSRRGSGMLAAIQLKSAYDRGRDPGSGGGAEKVLFAAEGL